MTPRQLKQRRENREADKRRSEWDKRMYEQRIKEIERLHERAKMDEKKRDIEVGLQAMRMGASILSYQMRWPILDGKPRK